MPVQFNCLEPQRIRKQKELVFEAADKLEPFTTSIFFYLFPGDLLIRILVRNCAKTEIGKEFTTKQWNRTSDGAQRYLNNNNSR